MTVFTLIDGSLLVLEQNAKYEVVSRRMTVQGGSPKIEIRRLEDLANELSQAVEKLKRKE